MKNFLYKCSPYGWFVALSGLIIGLPIAAVPFFPGEQRYIPAFLCPMLFSFLAGALICGATRGKKETAPEWQQPIQRGSLIILAVWCYYFALGAAPFALAGQLNALQALYESISGWTTTGLTLLDTAAAPRVIIFYRSYMQFCGGLGFILMMVLFFRVKHSMVLYAAEGHPDRSMPNLRLTSQVTVLIYCGLFCAGAILYRAFGMETFEAVCTALSALSTAGFSAGAGNIGAFDSVAVEAVTIALMLAGASNFAVLLLFAEGKVRRVLQITEIRFMFGLIAVLTPVAAAVLAAGLGMRAGESVRHALFGVVAVFSTTGFSTIAYHQWPPFLIGVVLLLMIVGGCSGSTSGGIKMSRAYLLYRITRENIRKRMSPSIKLAVPHYHTVSGKTPIDGELIADTFGFAVCYFGILAAGTLLLTLTSGCTLADALFRFTSVFTTTGITGGGADVAMAGGGAAAALAVGGSQAASLAGAGAAAATGGGAAAATSGWAAAAASGFSAPVASGGPVASLAGIGVAAAASGVGVPITTGGPNAATLIVEMLGMVLGRMEIFVVFFGVSSFVRLLRKHMLRFRSAHK